MKTIATTLAAATLALAGCSTQERVGMAQNECAQIGYPVGSDEYVTCVERGYRINTAQQDAAIGTIATVAILEAFF